MAVGALILSGAFQQLGEEGFDLLQRELQGGITGDELP